MATQLSLLANGAEVKLNEDGSPATYIVVNQGRPSSLYDSSCSGTWLLRKSSVESRVWEGPANNAYSGSSVRSWLNNTFLTRFDSDIQEAIKQIKLPYASQGGDTVYSGSSGLSTKVFLLSSRELGNRDNNNGLHTPVDGAKLDYFRYDNTTSANEKRKTGSKWWTRSPSSVSDTHVIYVHTTGSFSGSQISTGSNDVRPAFIMPDNAYADDSGNVFLDTPPSAPSSISVPQFALRGRSVSVSWSTVTDPDGGAISYQLERQVNDSGTWTQIYKGSSRSISTPVPSGAETLKYRVAAYNSRGVPSKTYRTSRSVPVYTKSSISVPVMAMQGELVTITWKEAEGADSYELQRLSSADSGWTQVYAGTDLTFTETVGTWTTLQYRVQAVFSGTGTGWSTASIDVVSAAALVISGTDGNLGTITSDIPYSVSSDTGNQISLTRTVNGVQAAALTVDSGFAYSIPVTELPTGTGTIVIAATVDTTSEPVTETRTWTYTKAAAAFPTAGGVAALSQDGQSIFPQTLAEAVKAIGGPWGGNLSTALDKLARAVTHTDDGNLHDLWGNVIPSVKIATGSYTGTGTYGSGNPTTIVFPFTPKIWGVYAVSINGGQLSPMPNILPFLSPDYNFANSMNMYTLTGTGGFNFPDFDSFSFTINPQYTLPYGIVFNKKSVEIWSSNANDQLNGNGYIYYYYAIFY